VTTARREERRCPQTNNKLTPGMVQNPSISSTTPTARTSSWNRSSELFSNALCHGRTRSWSTSASGPVQRRSRLPAVSSRHPGDSRCFASARLRRFQAVVRAVTEISTFASARASFVTSTIVEAGRSLPPNAALRASVAAIAESKSVTKTC